jgi:GTP diphosphokinase / guanosine-3',5'-bis(diphosphate) 3'-diphosphatase
VKGNRIARAVKIADMIDNSNLSRIPNPTQVDIDRLEKYKKGIKYLK